MAASPVTLTFPTLTDTVTAFANVTAWNAFFGAVTFTLDGSNLPTATAVSLGGVFAAANVAATTATWTLQTYTTGYTVPITSVDTGGVQSTVDVPTKDTVDKLITNVTQLKALYDNLVAALKTAGVMLNA